MRVGTAPPSTGVAAEGRGEGVASFTLYVFTGEEMRVCLDADGKEQ